MESCPHVRTGEAEGGPEVWKGAREGGCEGEGGRDGGCRGPWVCGRETGTTSKQPANNQQSEEKKYDKRSMIFRTIVYSHQKLGEIRR
jgi:hypothetical protein